MALIEGVESAPVDDRPGLVLFWSQRYLDGPSGRFALVVSMRELIDAYCEGRTQQASVDAWLPDLQLAVVEPHGAADPPTARKWFTGMSAL